MAQISIKEMFDITQRNNSQWGIEGYDVPKKYTGPNKPVLQGGKPITNPNRKVTKKGNYLDFQYKSQRLAFPAPGGTGKMVHKFLPAPNRYFPTKTFKDELKAQASRKQKPCDMKAVRRDEIWQLVHDSKKPGRFVPGPGKYFQKSIAAAQSELKALRQVNRGSKAPRTNFLMEYEWQSAQTPGPGSYHPRKHYNMRDMDKAKVFKQRYGSMKVDDWKKKHKVGVKVPKLKPIPVGDLRQPKQVRYNTFHTTSMNLDKIKASAVKCWGKEERFNFDPNHKSNKKVAKSLLNVTSDWGQDPTNKLASKDILTKVSKKTYSSIYYSRR